MLGREASREASRSQGESDVKIFRCRLADQHLSKKGHGAYQVWQQKRRQNKHGFRRSIKCPVPL